MRDVVQGYGPDAVASATNTLESSSRKGVQEAMQKAGYSLSAASMTATAGAPRAASGAAQDVSFTLFALCWIMFAIAISVSDAVYATCCHVLQKTILCLAVPDSAGEKPQALSDVFSVFVFFNILSQSLQQFFECGILVAGKAESKAMSGTMPKASSRPGTAKNVRSGTVRPGPTSAASAATALAANDGVCLQISNKKDERAKKVHSGCMPLLYCVLALPQ